MTIGTQQYAYLADHSYGRDKHGAAVDLQSLVGKVTEIGGLEYKVLAYSDKPSGYQGAVYQRMDTGEIVVAHRGTEFERERLKDLVKTDGGMVVGRDNRQADDAIALTRQAIELAKDYGATKGVAPPEVTVTGHSLGGTLAEVTGHYFGLKGETFNAFGAASLNMRNPATGEHYRIPEGGNAMVNHVMAADLVSSASPHYGQVKVYTNQREIDTLQKYGYENNRSVFDLRNDIFSAVAAMSGGSHDMDNFLPWNGQHRPDTSILADPKARQLAQQYDPMIDKFRADISGERLAATLLTRSGKGLVEDAWHLTRDPLPAGEPAKRAEQHDRRGASLDLGRPDPAPDMRDPGHPANGRYQQAYAGVARIDQGMGRAPDGSSERLAAALTAASPHLSSIDRVGLSPDGSRAFAVEASNGPAEARQRAQVEVASAVQRPVEVSTAQWQLATDQLAQSHARQQAQERANPVVQGPVMG